VSGELAVELADRGVREVKGDTRRLIFMAFDIRATSVEELPSGFTSPNQRSGSELDVLVVPESLRPWNFSF
jgi:hypothetical protein